MNGTSPYSHWEWKLREDRERRAKRISEKWNSEREQTPWLVRMKPFARTFVVLFGLGASYATLRIWAWSFGSC